ncbi:MAG: hypothetical protein ACETV1_00800 [Candidatus Bathyarchaeia archaeon]
MASWQGLTKLDILFIWDIAGIASMLARELTARSLKASCMMRREFDKGRISEFYGAVLHDGSGFIDASRKASEKARILHFSYLDSFSVKGHSTPLLPLFKYHGRKIIMHYHGSDIRGKGTQKRLYYAPADLVLVSSRDLLREVPDATWLPRPVDTDHFKPLQVARKKRSAVYVNVISTWLRTAEKFCCERGLSLTVVDRESDQWIRYSEYPLFLNRFEYFLDFKGQEELSKNALEALSCGLKVVHINRQGEISFHSSLPEMNHLGNVVKRYIELLREASFFPQRDLG